MKPWLRTGRGANRGLLHRQPISRSRFAMVLIGLLTKSGRFSKYPTADRISRRIFCVEWAPIQSADADWLRGRLRRPP
jgi:hypothetical protein